MKLVVNRKALADVLGKVSLAVRERSIQPITSCVNFEAGDRFKLEATNLEASVIGYCDAVIAERGSISLNPRPLLSFLAIGGETVSISTTPRQCCAETDSGRLTMEIKKGDFPIIAPKVNGVSLTLLGLQEAITKVEKAQASEGSRPALAGIAISPQANGIDVIAADGFRLVIAQLPLSSGTILPRMILVPRQTVALLQKLIGEQVVLTVGTEPGSRYASFESNGLTIITGLTQGTYPKYDSLIPKSSAYHLAVDALQLASAIKACGEPVSHLIRLHATEDVLTIRAHDGDDNAVEIKMPCRGQIKVAVNQCYLLDLLEYRNGLIEIMTNEPSSHPIMVQSDNLTHVLMPMWVEW